MEGVNAAGIPCYSGSCSEIYLEKAFDVFRCASSTGEVPGPRNRLPVAKGLGETSLMLLVHPTLTEENINDTIRVVKEVVARATK